MPVVSVNRVPRRQYAGQLTVVDNTVREHYLEQSAFDDLHDGEPRCKSSPGIRIRSIVDLYGPAASLHRVRYVKPVARRAFVGCD